MPANIFTDLTMVLGLGAIVDMAGVWIIVLGLFLSIIIFLKDWYREGELQESFVKLRKNLGRAILLGLEFLVAGDIIRSVAGNPTFTSIGILGLIVLIRSFLSITFDMEINGRWPWQKKL